ncbi:heterogeneous nuclear ribonucleoprotein Q isoform X2 [Gossypium hirsutum]|uniref:Heterogeneous nuclear ribonucleoprotein Q isoform X2 n=1 Tax=Gossypium hirsutum TaxID=3635 RepID=A0A1U8IVH7_GOSHI|nr:heterogeneous nuclear ribonucleoprotein Q isoform X2 [Gossypium hirsutum]
MSRTREENEEQIDLEGDNEQEETIEEEVEYEEIEEEEEVEVEEEVEEEVEDEDENAELVDVQKGSDGDEELNDSETEEEKKKKHAELLALPPHGSEVYIGGIPHDTSKEDLKRFCESIGEVIEVRIMKAKDLGEGNGYAFVTFRSKELASKAIERLNYSEFKGKKIKCSTSQAKNKLFIGNVPRNWGEEVMRRVVTDVGPGVGCIELLKDPMNPSRNRGFVFIEYYNHACAEYSRQKMLKPTFKLDDNAPTVSWADPRNAESSATTQVKSLYVKNLPRDITQDRLKKLFEHHGKITKVVVPPAKAGKEDSRSIVGVFSCKTTSRPEVFWRIWLPEVNLRFKLPSIRIWFTWGSIWWSWNRIWSCRIWTVSTGFVQEGTLHNQEQIKRHCLLHRISLFIITVNLWARSNSCWNGNDANAFA